MLRQKLLTGKLNWFRRLTKREVEIEQEYHKVRINPKKFEISNKVKYFLFGIPLVVIFGQQYYLKWLPSISTERAYYLNIAFSYISNFNAMMIGVWAGFYLVTYQGKLEKRVTDGSMLFFKHPRWLWFSAAFLILNAGVRCFESNLAKEYSGSIITLLSALTLFILNSGSTTGFFPLRVTRFTNYTLMFLTLGAISTYFQNYKERKNEIQFYNDFVLRNEKIGIKL